MQDFIVLKLIISSIIFILEIKSAGYIHYNKLMMKKLRLREDHIAFV